jgi:protein involved in polysaccharide export with SLBB domain
MRKRTTWTGTLAVILAVLAGSAEAVYAQNPAEWDAAREQMTRTELESLLERLEEQALSTAYSSRMRSQAQQSVELVRRRLAEGDFQVGDRIVLEVRNEPELSDELLVRSGRVVDIPVVGEVSLHGVLRSELQQVLEEHIGAYIRDPVVRTQSLIRISVIGQVGSPGFHVFPADFPITDILMQVGGPGSDANLSRMRIERGNTRIWEGETLEMAMIQGRTLDQMNLQAGDRIVVPPGGAPRDGWETFRLVTGTLGAVASLAWAVTRLTR